MAAIYSLNLLKSNCLMSKNSNLFRQFVSLTYDGSANVLGPMAGGVACFEHSAGRALGRMTSARAVPRCRCEAPPNFRQRQRGNHRWMCTTFCGIEKLSVLRSESTGTALNKDLKRNWILQVSQGQRQSQRKIKILSFDQTKTCVLQTRSQFSTESSSGPGIGERELKKEIEDLTDLFMETRELLADAMEGKGTVYFDEDLQEAKESIEETLAKYKSLLSKLSEEQERNVRRTIGLKMEELKAQEAMIIDSLNDD